MQGMGKRLRARARELGLSDTEVARRLDLSQPRYANYVNDVNEPDLGTLVRICRVLDTTPDTVLGVSVGNEIDDAGTDVYRSRINAASHAMNASRLRIAASLMDTLASLSQENLDA